MFVHVDPFTPLDNECDMNSIDLFVELLRQGVKVVLWYGYDTKDQREELFEEFYKVVPKTECQVCNGEITLDIIQKDVITVNPGVLGCGILIGNLSAESVETLEIYGKALEKLYKMLPSKMILRGV